MFHNQDRQSMRKRTISIFLLLCGISVFLPQAGSAQQDETSTPGESPRTLNLSQAVMCEDVFANAPRNQTVVFSVAREKAVCFTSFDKVSAKTFIYHNFHLPQLVLQRHTQCQNTIGTSAPALVYVQQYTDSKNRHRTLAGGSHR
jgi:hypothetical protein